MEKSELVVELGVEEIPASMIEDSAQQFRDILLDLLKSRRLDSDG
jgi:glycyl-tRNA synthetase beta subunit